MGLNLLDPNDLSDVLVFQKKAFSFIQRVPVAFRFSIEVRYCARIKNRITNQYAYIHTVITPLLFDEEGNVVLDIANWQYADPIQPINTFQWSLSFIDQNGHKVEEQSVQDKTQVESLSGAESKVFHHLLEGKTSRKIAESLNLSKHTIDTHRRKILKKLKCSSTNELLSVYCKEY